MSKLRFRCSNLPRPEARLEATQHRGRRRRGATKLGKISDASVLGLHADAALNAMKDAGLTLADIDGVATAAH